MAKRMLVLTDRLGSSNTELGNVLMRNFCYALARASEQPSVVMLMNEGVRLVCEGSEVLDDLRLLVESGVAVKACGTCLDFLGLSEKLEVGDVGTMVDGVDALMGSDDIVTIA